MKDLEILQSRQFEHLRGADLEEQDLSGFDLRDIDLSGANLVGANLSSCRLETARLEGTNLLGATVGVSSFQSLTSLARLCTERTPARLFSVQT